MYVKLFDKASGLPAWQREQICIGLTEGRHAAVAGETAVRFGEQYLGALPASRGGQIGKAWVTVEEDSAVVGDRVDTV